MPMGNPLSPTIAGIVMDKLIDVVTEELKENNIKIKFLTKYVDDLFAIIKKGDEDIILKTFNNYHNKLKFTIEKEKDKCISYLDMKIYRNQNKIITDWYTKSIASGRLINFHSTQPIKQKTNTAINLITKVLKISDKQFEKKNIEKIKEILINNSYPEYIINNLIRKVKYGEENKTKDNTAGNTKKFYSLSYIPKLTESKQMREIINDKEIAWAYRSNKTINNLFTKIKTKIETKEQSNVVYQIECLGNADESCGKVYIGTTKRSLNIRASEHEIDIKKQKHTTALAQHCIENNHRADLENIKILDKEIRESKRYMLESLRIQQRGENAINKKEDKDNASANYSIIIF